MLSNQAVINAFINDKSASNTNLRSCNGKLVNYTTCIAQKMGDHIIVNMTKYSVSTSKIQNWVKRELCSYVPTTKHVPLGTQNLRDFI